MTTSPTAPTEAGEPAFATVTEGDWATSTRNASTSPTGGPAGGVPVTLAELSMKPRSRSACTTVYVAVHVVVAAGANVATGQVTADRPGRRSVTATPVSVTLPVLTTANE